MFAVAVSVCGCLCRLSGLSSSSRCCSSSRIGPLHRPYTTSSSNNRSSSSSRAQSEMPFLLQRGVQDGEGPPRRPSMGTSSTGGCGILVGAPTLPGTAAVRVAPGGPQRGPNTHASLLVLGRGPLSLQGALGGPPTSGLVKGAPAVTGDPMRTGGTEILGGGGPMGSHTPSGERMIGAPGSPKGRPLQMTTRRQGDGVTRGPPEGTAAGLCGGGAPPQGKRPQGGPPRITITGSTEAPPIPEAPGGPASQMRRLPAPRGPIRMPYMMAGFMGAPVTMGAPTRVAASSSADEATVGAPLLTAGAPHQDPIAPSRDGETGQQGGGPPLGCLAATGLLLFVLVLLSTENPAVCITEGPR